MFAWKLFSFFEKQRCKKVGVTYIIKSQTAVYVNYCFRGFLALKSSRQSLKKCFLFLLQSHWYISYKYCSRSCWDAFYSKPISYFVTCFAGFYCQRVPEFHESSVYTAGTSVILESFKFKPWRWCKWNEKGCYSLCLISRLMGIQSQFWDMMLSAQRKVVISNVVSFTP